MGEKTSCFPGAQARASQPARLSRLRAQTGVCASCPPQGRKPPASLGPRRGSPSQPAVETPRPNRRVRVLPAAGEKTACCPRAQARASQPARLSKLRAQTGACASCPPQAKKTAALLGDCFQCWRKPIFPGRHQPSIFGAGELNFRVRDGNGWTLAAINTNYFVLPSLSTAQ